MFLNKPKSNSLSFMLFACLSSTALAQALSPGETVYCCPTGSQSDWRQGTVIDDNPKLNYVRIKCGPGNGRPEGIFLVARSDIKPLSQPGLQNNAGANAAGTPAAIPASAAQANRNLSPGQIVSCLPTGSPGDVRSGKILENNPLYNYIRVECGPGADGRPGGIFLISPKDILSGAGSADATTGGASFKQTVASPAQINASKGAHSNKGNTGTVPGVTARTTTPATAPATTAGTNPNCACPPMSDLSGSSRESIWKAVIAARYVNNGHALDAGHTPSTVNFKSMQFLKSRPYAMPVPGAYYTGSPDGPGGRMGTIVYEVATKYTVCIDYPGSPISGYRGRIYKVDHDAKYTCFVNAAGQWQCNQSADKMESQSIDK